MSWEKLKRNLIEVKNYQPQSEAEAIKIEEKMLDEVASLLRVIQDEKEIQFKGVSNDISKDIEKEKNDEGYDIKVEHLTKLEKNIENYNISEFILHIMLNTHNDWFMNNINKYDLKHSEKAYMFVPFNMLSWNEIENRYLNVLTPILNSLDIEYNKDDTEKQFRRNQTVFLIDKGIFSKEDLLQGMKNIMANSYEIIYDLDKKDRDNLFNDDVISNIAKQASDKIELNGIKRFKDILSLDKNEIGIITAKDMQRRKRIYKFADNIGQRKFGFKKIASPVYNRPISKILYDIGTNNNIIFVQNIRKHDYKYIDCSSDINRPVQFIKYDDCSDEQRKLIVKRNKKVKKFVDKVNNSNNKKYMEPGLVTFVTTNKIKNLMDDASKNVYGIKVEKISYPEIIQIPMTLKELARIEMLPQEIGWEARSKALIHSKKSRVLGLTSSKEKGNYKRNDFLNSVKVKADVTLSKNIKNEKSNIEKEDKER